MNDNRIEAPPFVRNRPFWSDVPQPCRCGSSAVCVDGYLVKNDTKALFVWCAGCEVEGPKRPTYALAVAAWNSGLTR
jgi:hypothetical protein